MKCENRFLGQKLSLKIMNVSYWDTKTKFWKGVNNISRKLLWKKGNGKS